MAKKPKNKLPKKASQEPIYKKPKDLDIYYEIIWEDAVVDGNGWSNRIDDQKTHKVRSVGWILKDDEDGLVIAGDVSTDDVEDFEHNRRAVIPRGFLKKITKKKFGG